MNLPMKIRIIMTATYLLSTLLSYALMLVVMSFNVGLFLACVFGLAFGYFIFGYLKKRGHAQAKVTAGQERIYNPEGDKCCVDVDFD